MAKGQQKNSREEKKKPVMSLKEKRAAKRDKTRAPDSLLQNPRTRGGG